MYKLNAIAVSFSLLLLGCNQETRQLDTQTVSPSLVEMDLTNSPSHEDISAAGQLGGVLTPTQPVFDKQGSGLFGVFSFGSNDEGERLMFGRAIQKWNKHDYISASEDFDRFRKKYPNSAWEGEASLHMACNARFTGQYSVANELFSEIISKNQNSDYIGAQHMTAKAQSRLAVLRLMENNPQEAKKLFSEVHKNAPDWRLRTYASTWLRKLSLLENDSGSLLDCGTRALSYLLEQDGLFDKAEEVLGYAPTSNQGFSMSDLSNLAQQSGYEAHPVTLIAEELAIAVDPVILQISRESTGGKGHYWILERVASGIFYIFDPQMNRRFEFGQSQLEKEWQGNAILLSRTSTPSIGQLMSIEEAETTYGGCCGIQRPPSDAGNPNSNPDEPNPEPDCGDNPKGAPIWKVNMVNMNLYVTDIPLWYENELGPDINIQLSYNTQSVLAQNEPFGNKWMFNYSSYVVVDPGGAVTIFGTDGSESVFIKDSQGNYKSDRHARTHLKESSNGQFILTYADGFERVYGIPHNTKALQYFLLEERDKFGNKVSFNYDNSARMTSITDSYGRKSNLSYNGDGLIEKVTDPFGRQATFEYDQARNLVSITDMQGYKATFTYDHDRLISSLGNAKGTTFFNIEPSDGISNGSNPYNPPGTAMWENYRITVTLPTGKKEEYYYNGYGKKSWYVNADNYHEYHDEKNNFDSNVAKTIYEFVTPNGRQGKIAKVIYPDGTFTKYTYDGKNQLTSVTNPSGLKETYFRNDKGLLTKVIDHLGNATIYTYDSNSLDLIGVETVNGTLSYQYDSERRLTSIKDIDGNLTKFTYSPAGLLSTITDVDGIVTQLERNDTGKIIQVIQNNHVINEYSHDEVGRISTIKDINGYVSNFEYNKIGSVIKVTEPSGRVVENVFGTCPRMLNEQITSVNRKHKFSYDGNKELTEVVNPILAKLTINRTPSGLISSLVDSEQNVTRFEYNSIGALKKKTYSDNSSIKYEYDRQQLSKIINARGTVKTFVYNSLRQVEEIKYSDDTPGVRYQYDAQGRVIAVTDQFGLTKIKYHSNGQVESFDGPWDKDRVELSYTASGKLKSIILDGKTNSEYTYDSLGRLASVIAFGRQFTYKYDNSPLSPLFSVEYPSGLAKTYEYNSSAELSKITHSKSGENIASYLYQYDLSGQLKEQTGTPSWFIPQKNVKAKYNSLNQIVEWNSDKTAFEYDSDGNLIKGLIGVGIPFIALYDAENRLIKIDFSEGGKRISEHFAYRYDHMLAQYERFENNTLVESKRFVRLGLLELQQRNDENVIEQEYVWEPHNVGGVGGLLLTKAENKYFEYVYNNLGSVQKIVDESGKVVSSYLYSPYGRVAGSNFSLQPFGFSTKRSDFSSKLVYFGYRFYVPELRRWLNRDPLHEQDNINLYAYVNGDPLNYVDPTGLFKVCKRPLSFAGDYMSSGKTGLNLGIFHEHGFYEDGTLDNTGFTNSGTFDDRDNIDKYQCSDKSYDDERMRQAQKNISDDWQGGYNVITNNCQDYIDALIDEYEKQK